MPVLRLDDAHLAFGHVPLLDAASFQLDEGERVVLIGRNGAGKSSLLRVLAGEQPLDDGLLWRQPGLRLAYVPQEADFPPQATVAEVLTEGLGEAAGLLRRFQALSRHVAATPEPALLAELDAVQQALEREGGWQWQHRIDAALAALGLEAEARIASLSGGGVKRVALARALVAEPEVLLLDEPTNHLDIAAIERLEQMLLTFRGSVVLVTHDRALVDRVATRIVELDRGRLASFPGSFAEYERRKAEQLAAEAQAQARFDKFHAQEEAWIRKGVEARRTRNEGRVRRLERLREEREARRERLGRVRLQLEAGEQSGRLVAELVGVTKSWGERTVVRDFSTTILRGDRIGFIGPNGAGKTTLLKLILGEIEPDAGLVRHGTRRNVAYFDQMRAQLDPEARLIDVVSPGSDTVEIAGQRRHVVGYLEDFLFSPQRARSPVKTLSGGERNRLLLARLFAQPANVLVLDEPTNDLDLDTLELLEERLLSYSGTLLLVSHDRRFLDNVVTQVIASTGDGRWEECVGGYSDWLRLKGEVASVSAAPGPTKAPVKAKVAAVEEPRSSRPRRLSYRERQELEALPQRIEALEAEQAALAEALADPRLYSERAQEVAGLKSRLTAVEEEIEALLERWSELEALAAGEG